MNRKGFTLVELLAVIVILAVILVIAVPRITDTIESVKENSFLSTAKLIINSGEKKYEQNQLLGNSYSINCSDLTNLNSEDYSYCDITFDSNGNASLTLIGSGKFEDLCVFNGTNDNLALSNYNAIATNEQYFTFGDVVTNVEVTNQTKCKSYFQNRFGLPEASATEFCGGGTLYGMTIRDFTAAGYVLSTNYESAGLNVETDSTKVTIIDYDPAGGTDVIIPSRIDGKVVVRIGGEAFYNNALTNVTIPNSVTTIGNRAFQSNALTSVIIGNSVMAIGDEAFYNNALTSVTIPNSVTKIGNHAFVNNALTSVAIPNSVTTIGYSAFSYNALTSVTIPNSVTTIGIGAFLKYAYSNSNPNLTTIINQTGRSFDWESIVNGNSGYNFITGTIVNDGGNVNVIS